VLWQAAALALALLFVAPLYWVLSSSLRPVGLPPPHTFEWLPQPPAWSNYTEVFRIVPLGRQALNSLLVSSVGAGLTVVTASWAGLAMAQMSPGVRRVLVALAVGLLMVPGAAVWLPRYVLFSRLGLIDTYLALFAAAFMGTKSLYVLMFYWNFRRLPQESYEAARLEGAGALTVWRRIALPAALPTTLAVLLLAFTHYWSDFVDPLLFLKSEERYTLAVGLRMLQQMSVTQWSLLLAGAVVMTLPVILIYLVLQHLIRPEATWPRLFRGHH
jgi:multiple sugar transport system permease protein